MYLSLFDADGNSTPKVFHDGVNVIKVRVVGEEKGRRKRSDRKGLTEKIRLRRSIREDLIEKNRLRRSAGEDPKEKACWRRGLTSKPIMALIPCERIEEKNTFLY